MTGTGTWIAAIPSWKLERGYEMIELSGSNFTNLQQLDALHTTRGVGASPGLHWSDLPEGTQELVLVCENWGKLKVNRWFHWLVYKISCGSTGIDVGDVGDALVGRSSSGEVGFDPPDPAHCRGLVFWLYALGTHLEVGPGLWGGALFSAMKGQVLDLGSVTALVGTRHVAFEPASFSAPPAVSRRSGDSQTLAVHPVF